MPKVTKLESDGTRIQTQAKWASEFKHYVLVPLSLLDGNKPKIQQDKDLELI